MSESRACLRFEDPEHRLPVLLTISLAAGGLVLLIFALAGDVVRGIYAGLVVGPTLGFVMSVPERWELEGDELRQVHPKRDAGRLRLSQVRSLDAKLQVKGQVDVWAVPARGARVMIPTCPGRRADAFRREIFSLLPPEVLAGADDPLIVELVASAARQVSDTNE